MDFKSLPDDRFTLHNVTVPACLLGKSGDLLCTDISIANGKIATPDDRFTVVDMQRAMLLPALVDMHTHLDKGHILPRAANPDGTFPGALQSVHEDHQHWSREDVLRRADFSLRCAYAHGTRAVRTHLDSAPPQDEISWPTFSILRDQWAGKVDLQAVCLVGCEGVDLQGRFKQTAELVKQHGGVLGLVAYPMAGLETFLIDFFELAASLDLAVDLHVDESMNPEVECIRSVCKAVIQTDFQLPVTVGHLCSLSAQTQSRAADTINLIAKAGLNVVSLPMCNLYLQDRQPNFTPRQRGVTLVHEMKRQGIAVSFASDNTRDPFYAYGDMDMLEVMREATRIAHLDHSEPDWIKAFTTTPSDSCGFSRAALEIDDPADLVIVNARNYDELLSRPQSDRIVLRNGTAIDRSLPHYAELDDLAGYKL